MVSIGARRAAHTLISRFLASSARDGGALKTSSLSIHLRAFSTTEATPTAERLARAHPSRASWWSATTSGAPATFLFTFANDADVARWNAFGDFEHGGASECVVERQASDGYDDGYDRRRRSSAIRTSTTNDTADVTANEDVLALTSSYGVLRGNISSEIPIGGQSALVRSGFAGMRTKPLVATLTNPDPVMDFDAFDALSYRVRGDGRAYIASLRTENWLTDDTSRDVWQCAFQPPAGEWVDVVIPIDAFTQTYRGRAVHDHTRMSANRVVYAGISVAGSVETDLDARRRSDGAFRLDVHSVVGLRMSEDEMEAHASRRRSHVEHPCGGFALLALECATDQSSCWLSRDKDEDDVEY